MTKSVGVHQAKTHLSRLLEEVEAGQEISITNRGRTVARLVPPRQPDVTFGWGRDRGAWIADDFDAPLPTDLQQAFER